MAYENGKNHCDRCGKVIYGDKTLCKECNEWLETHYGKSRKNNDAVSRQEVIDLLENDIELTKTDKCRLEDKVHTLDSAFPSDWIPVTEDLPEENDVYFVTWKTSTVNRKFIQLLEFDEEEQEWILKDYMKNYENVEITAWMPVPKLYEE